MKPLKSQSTHCSIIVCLRAEKFRGLLSECRPAADKFFTDTGTEQVGQCNREVNTTLAEIPDHDGHATSGL